MSVRAMMDPKKLRDHPINMELYGKTELSQGFLDSIAENGILQNLIVTHHENKCYVVSGHRRRDAATMLGIKEVPVEVRTYESLEEAEDDLIALNMFREKTEKMIAAEAERLLLRYGKEAEARQKAGTPSSPVETKGRADDQAAEVLGVSRGRLRRILTVYGDQYQANKLSELDLPEDEKEAILRTWRTTRAERMLDQISLSRAAKTIEDLLKQAGKEAPDRPKIRRPSWSMKWSEVPEGSVPSVFATRQVEEDVCIKFADIDGQVCLLVGKQMAPIDIQYVKYLNKEEG